VEAEAFRAVFLAGALPFEAAPFFGAAFLDEAFLPPAALRALGRLADERRVAAAFRAGFAALAAFLAFLLAMASVLSEP